MKKYFFAYIFPVIFALLYGVIIIFSLTQPETERGVGLLLAFIFSFPSSLLVAELIQSPSCIGFALECFFGILQYMLLGFIIDLVRLRVKKMKEKSDAAFNQMKYHM